MPDAPVDPRRRGFAAPVRPVKPDPPPTRRGIAGPPPSKPVTAPVLDAEDEPTAPESPKPSATGPVTVLPAPAALRAGQPSPGAEQAKPVLGVQRHNMRYVQFQLSPVLSDLLTARAEAEDVVLGEVVMDALRAFDAQPKAAPTRRRRRRSNVGVRRSILVRPDEANQIKEMADQYGEKPSGMIRRCLEAYLS
jgi:hypothetical protein